MLNLDRYIVVPTKNDLIFFAKHKISDWGFDFTKLGNLMKDEVDLMLKKDFPEDTPVFGILVGGNNIIY
jgi:hypothetical protein